MTKIIKHPSPSIDLQLKGEKITTFFTVLLNHPDARLGLCANKPWPGSRGAVGAKSLPASTGIMWGSKEGVWGASGGTGTQDGQGGMPQGKLKKGRHETGFSLSSSEEEDLAKTRSKGGRRDRKGGHRVTVQGQEGSGSCWRTGRSGRE